MCSARRVIFETIEVWWCSWAVTRMHNVGGVFVNNQCILRTEACHEFSSCEWREKHHYFYLVGLRDTLREGSLWADEEVLHIDLLQWVRANGVIYDLTERAASCFFYAFACFMHEIETFISILIQNLKFIQAILRLTRSVTCYHYSINFNRR